jgi:dihydroorotate dehydrogenase (NAD+) catalytic subunit
MKKSELSVSFAGFEMKNPLMLGSSDLTVNRGGILKFAEAGFGAVITKTTTKDAFAGNPKPWISSDPYVDCAAAGGLPNPGLKVMLENINATLDKVHKAGCKLITSLAGETIEEHQELARALEKAGADAIQINTCCPHRGPVVGCSDQIAEYWSRDNKRALELTKAVKSAIKIPLIMKYRSDLILISPEVGVAMEKGGADAETIAAGQPGMPIDIYTTKSRLGNIEGVGAAHGPTLRHINVKRTADMVRVLNIPVIGSGGVVSGLHAIEFLMVGASAVELCSAMYWEGPQAINKYLKEISHFMKKQGYATVQDMVGVALKNLPPISKVYKDLGFKTSNRVWERSAPAEKQPNKARTNG